MSTDSSPFISIDYDSEDFPTAYEKKQLGNYRPEAVFLAENIDRNPELDGVDVYGEDLNEFFSELIEPKKIIFRYSNNEVLESHRENPVKDESEIYRRAPPFRFETEEVKLDPNIAWMDMLDDLHEVVGLFGVQRIDFVTPGDPRKNSEDLENYIQKSGVHMVPDIQGVSDLKYDWLRDEIEIKKYSDKLVLEDEKFSPGDEHGEVMSDPDGADLRFVDYDVDNREIKRLVEELERNFTNVSVDTFTENVIPPEIRDEL